MKLFKSQGWKGFAAGIGLMVMGVIRFGLTYLMPESEHALSFDEALKLILGGLAVIGIRAKMEDKEQEPQIEREGKE